jgi:MFS family permease
VGTLAGFLMIAGANSLVMVFAGRILDGLTAGNLSVAQAYIADHTPPERRARSFALIGIAFGTGFLLGPAVTAYLSVHGLAVPLYAAALLSFTSIVCTSVLLPREPGVKSLQLADAHDLPAGRRPSLFAFGEYRKYFVRRPLSGLLWEFFFYIFAFSMFTGSFALFAERRYVWHGQPFSPREIGILFALAGAVGLVVQGGLLGRLVSAIGERRLVATGLVSLGVGLALFGYVDPVVPLACAGVLAAFGNSLLRPCLTSLLTKAVTRREQGTVLGLAQSLASLAAILAAPVAGWLLERRYLTAWGWTAAAFCGAALIARRWGSALVVENARGREG